MLKYILFYVDCFWFVFICFQNSIGKRIWKKIKQKKKRMFTCTLGPTSPLSPFALGPVGGPADQLRAPHFPSLFPG